MTVDDREDQYRESVPVPEPAEDNTPLEEPDAETQNNTDTIDTNPADQPTPVTPDRDS